MLILWQPGFLLWKGGPTDTKGASGGSERTLGVQTGIGSTHGVSWFLNYVVNPIIGGFFYSLKSIHVPVWGHSQTWAEWQNIWVTWHVPTWGRRKQCSQACSSCSSPSVSKCLFCSLFSATSSPFFMLSVGDVAVNTAPKCSAEELFNVPKHKEAVMWFMEIQCYWSWI